MRNSDFNTRTRTSFLLSLILHVVMALVLGLILLEPPREMPMESVAVDMVSTTRRTIPARRIERPEAWRNIPDSRNLRKQETKMQLDPRRLYQADADFTKQSYSSDAATVLPELSTSVDRLRSRLDMPLPRAKGATIEKPGTDSRGSDSGRSGTGSIGLSPEAGIFETALYWIARNTAARNKTGKEDIVFLIDASGSMEENIAAVARYLSRMIDVFEEGGLDYTMVVIEFKLPPPKRDDDEDSNADLKAGVTIFNLGLENNHIALHEQTRDPNQVKAILRSIQCDGDERTLDAIEVGLTQVEFRHPVDKTFILVTDEAFIWPRSVTRRTRKDLTRKEILQADFQEIMEMCQRDGVKVNVLGIDDEKHRLLAKNTGGMWFQIPQRDSLP